MQDSQKIIRRLNIIKGQIEGITKMITEKRECKDILYQIKAVKSGFTSIAETFIKEHLKDCIVGKNANGKNIPMADIDEILSLFAKL